MRIKKILFTIIVISLISVNLLTAQNPLQGEWKGSIKTPGQELNVILNFTFENEQIKGLLIYPSKIQ